jgi:hypothetical protein
MSSERRIQANRANAAKSTGPLTVQGKRNSSRNSLQHGMLARAIVLDSESTVRFTALLTALTEELQPQTGVESALVENMAVARWRQMRLWGMEKAGIANEIQKQESSADSQDTLSRDAPTRAALAFRTLSDNSRSLELMNRYEGRYERQYGRALDRLIQLRQKGNFSKRTHSSADFDSADFDNMNPAPLSSSPRT